MAEKPGTISKSEFTNYLRLQMLVSKSSEILRRLFITEWNLTSGNTKWEDNDSNRKDFLNGPGKELHQKSQKIQKEYLQSRKLTEWDLPLLIQATKSLKINAPYKVLDELKSVRNKLAHLSEPKVNDEEYEEYWNQISILLLKLNLSPEEIEKVKFTLIEADHQSPEPLTLDSKVKELRDSGNQAFKEERFDDCIDFYTEAICTPGVSNKDLAILYSNRSVAFLKLGDVSSAKEDAKGSIHLCPTWWKGYFRLAKAYKANEKYQLTLKNLMLAQRFHDKPEQLDDEINLCKLLSGQQRREEHFDPMYFCNTHEGLAEHFPNLTPEFSKLTRNLGGKYLGSIAMCAKGHDYHFGRGVQQDYKEAASWYGKAAAEGNAEGMYNLALMMVEGKGVSCNFTEGILLLKQAASKPKLMNLPMKQKCRNLGVSEAEHSLGLYHEQGIGVLRNYEMASYWYKRAIKHWSGPSANNMAFMHLQGTAVPMSLDLAFQYWKLGAAMGNVRSMENLAHNYFRLGDFENMQQWYLYATEHGSVTLKLGSVLKYQDYFLVAVTKNFKKNEFTAALWLEVESGPLNHLIDPEIKAVEDSIKDLISTVSKVIPRSVPAYKIDSSTAETYRKSITLAHRESFKEYNKRGNIPESWGNNADLRPKPVIDLFNLKPIYLDEMSKKNIDHIYEGFVLKLAIMEDPIDKKYDTTAIDSIVRDEQNSYQRLFIYSYHPTKDDLQKSLGFGSKISIVNPYYRITRDGSPGIRVDDFNTVFVHHSLKNEKLCRYCGDENYAGRPVSCRTCKRCYYCSKKCLKLDGLELQHNLVCKKRI